MGWYTEENRQLGAGCGQRELWKGRLTKETPCSLSWIFRVPGLICYPEFFLWPLLSSKLSFSITHWTFLPAKSHLKCPALLKSYLPSLPSKCILLPVHTPVGCPPTRHTELLPRLFPPTLPPRRPCSSSCKSGLSQRMAIQTFNCLSPKPTR